MAKDSDKKGSLRIFYVGRLSVRDILDQVGRNQVRLLDDCEKLRNLFTIRTVPVKGVNALGFDLGIYQLEGSFFIRRGILLIVFASHQPGTSKIYFQIFY